MKSVGLVFSCEHGGNKIPRPYAKRFATTRAQAALASHRGYDPGSLEIAKRLAVATRAPLFRSTTSRLLIDLNRSLDHEHLFSEFTAKLNDAEKLQIIREHYSPYREAVVDEIKTRVSRGEYVIHVGVHSFTPMYARKHRSIDVGWLYDPSRSHETTFCDQWLNHVAALAPTLRLRFNSPYEGTSDGLTTSLRSMFVDESYAGIELEISQAFGRNARRLQPLLAVLTESLTSLLQSP